MAKAIVSVGYRKYVMNIEEAITFGNLLAKAEQYDEKWHKDTGNGSSTTKHIWEIDEDSYNIVILPDAAYTTYKLAGKPKE